MKLIAIIGTRPELIKMSPVVKALKLKSDIFQTKILFTGQHEESLKKNAPLMGIAPDISLSVIRQNQSLGLLTAKLLSKIDKVIHKERPDWIIAQGDTSSVFVSSLLAFYHKIKFAHVEAGLRTKNKFSPFPEEFNRFVCGYIADINFAPTKFAVNNLISENIPIEKILLTGNTGIDSLLDAAKWTDHSQIKILEGKKIILMTTHRRENFKVIQNIFKAIQQIAQNHQDIHIFYPLHINPVIQKKARELLSDIDNIELLPPQDYTNFVHLIKKSDLILTDSGGIQEEAPTFGIPVLIMREETERPEGIKAGVAKLVGTNKDEIINAFNKIYKGKFQKHSITNPYGDGKASERIIKFFESQI